MYIQPKFASKMPHASYSATVDALVNLSIDLSVIYHLLPFALPYTWKVSTIFSC